MDIMLDQSESEVVEKRGAILSPTRDDYGLLNEDGKWFESRW